MEGPGHSHGSGSAVVDDSEVGLGWSLILSLPPFGAVGNHRTSLCLSVGVPGDQGPCYRKVLIGGGCHLSAHPAQRSVDRVVWAS